MSQLIQSFELPRRRSEMSFEHMDESQLVQLEKQVQMLMVSVTVCSCLLFGCQILILSSSFSSSL